MINRFLLHLLQLLLVSGAVLSTVPCTAVCQQWVWAVSPGGPRTDAAGGIGIDSAGNSYVVGTYAGSITFDLTTLSNGRDTGFFIVKYNSFGGYQWASQGNGNGTFTDAVIAVDSAGICYVAGSFSGSVNFNGTQLTSAGARDIFVAKYNYYGMQQWVKRFGGVGDERVHGVAADGSGGMMLAGAFSGSLGMPDGPLVSAGGYDAFVVRIDTTGEPDWGIGAGAGADDAARAVAVAADGTVYVAGRFRDSIRIAGRLVHGVGGDDGFVACYDLDGAQRWVAACTGPDDEAAVGVVVVDATRCVAVGNFTSTQLTVGAANAVNAGAGDVFVVTLDNNGGVESVKGIGGASNEVATNACRGSDGLLVITGSFAGSMPSPSGPIASAGGRDMFVAGLRSGSVQWVRRAGGDRDDQASALAIDRSGEVFVVGDYDSTATFDVFSLQGRGGRDVSVARLGAPSVIRTSELVGSPFCVDAGLVVSFTTTGVFGVGNVFTAQLSDTAGSFARPVTIGSIASVEGASIAVTIPATARTGTRYRMRVVSSLPPVTGIDNGADLAIHEIPRPVIQPGPQAKLCSGQSVTLDAGAGFASYQWSNGAVTRMISVAEPGSYAVTVSIDAGCVGTSDPVQVTVVQSPAKPEIFRVDPFLECTPADGYQWFRDGVAITDATDRRYLATEPGIYTVRVTNVEGCTAMSDPYVLTAGVRSDRVLSGVRMSPQPTTGLVTIEIDDAGTRGLGLVLVDALGRRVVERMIETDGGPTRAALDLTSLVSGRYFVRIATDRGIWVGDVVKR